MSDELSKEELKLAGISAELCDDMIEAISQAAIKYDDRVDVPNRVDVFAAALAACIVEMFPGPRFPWFLNILDDVKSSEKLQ